MISIKNLTVETLYLNIYKRTRILDNITLNLEPGHVLGLVGRTGSGKSSFIKAMLTLVRPKSGSILIDNKSPSEYLKNNQIGYLPENPYFYKYLTALEVLTFFSKVIQPTYANREKMLLKILEKINLARYSNTHVREFSKGMLRRLGMGQAILFNPSVLLLDEPLYALDPMGRSCIKNIISELKMRGSTILFSSHNLYDIEKVCDQVAILDNGKIIKKGNINHVLPNTIAGIEVITDIVNSKILKEIELISAVTNVHQDQLTIFVPEVNDLHVVLRFLYESHIRVRSIKTIRQSLEDFFLKIVPDEDLDTPIPEEHTNE